MVQQQLVDYIKSQLKQGYSVSQVKNALLSTGYAQTDVDSALRLAGAKHITTGILVIAFISTLALALTVILILNATKEPPAELAIELSLFTASVKPDSDLVASIIITNTGGSTNGLLDLSATSSGIELARTTEEFNINDAITLPITLRIPADSEPGTAEARAQISWGARTKTATAPFTIATDAEETALPQLPIDTTSEPEPLITAREQQERCPASCDDLNFCTTDTCTAGRCVNTEITPCCGNRACEIGENDNACAIDCAEETPDQDAILAQAITQAPNNINTAFTTCQSLGQANYVDLCFSEISLAANNKQPCESITTEDLRDGCYIQFAYQNDAESCTHIQNPSMKTNCEQIIALGQIQGQYGST